MAEKALAIRSTQELISFDDKKLNLIKDTIAKALNPAEFELFIAIAKARGLDPVLNQIHAVKRKFKENGSFVERMVIQVGIDGLRLIASRTGEFAGCDEITYQHNDKEEIISAKATVYRIVAGQRCSFVGTARWSEFFPGEAQGFMWNKMPYNQLGKCAEAQALRKGFPGDLSGMYAPEELEREEVDVTPEPKQVAAPQPFDDDARTKKIKEVVSKFMALQVSEDDIKLKFNLESVSELSDEQYKELNRIGAAIKRKEIKKEDAFPVF